MASQAKTPKRKFATPFKSPASSLAVSQPVSQASSKSCFPDDGLDDSLLWYPDNYTKSAANPPTPIPVVPEPVKNGKTKPQKPAAKSKRFQKAPAKDNAMPYIPRAKKSPTRIARIIPKTPTKKSTLKNVATTPKRKGNDKNPNTPRTPTFQLYGVKSPYTKSTPIFSQTSTPGLTQNTLLKKLSQKNQQKNESRNRSLEFLNGNNGNEKNGNEENDCDISIQNLDAQFHADFPNTSGLVTDEATRNSNCASPTHEPATLNTERPRENSYTEVYNVQRDVDEEPQQQQENQPPKDPYNFRMSPNSQKIQHRKTKKAFREMKIKNDLLHLIAATAHELRGLRKRREELRLTLQNKGYGALVS